MDYHAYTINVLKGFVLFWSSLKPKMKVAFHQFLLIGVLVQNPNYEMLAFIYVFIFYLILTVAIVTANGLPNNIS